MSSGVRRCIAVLSLTFLSTLFALTQSSPAMAAPGAFDLISPTNGAWCTATCAFSWQGASSAASYQLYMDGTLKKDSIAPASPLGYTLTGGEALGDGWHTWYVVAKDSTGAMQQSTSTFSVRVDATPPTAPVLTSPVASAWLASDSPTFSWAESTDAGSGVAGYEIWINGAVVKTGLGPATTSAPAPMPIASIFKDDFASCSGWTLVPDWTNNYTWSCDYQGDISSYALSLYALATTGMIGGKATSGAIDLSNVGSPKLKLHEAVCGSFYYDVQISDGSAAGFRVVRDQYSITQNCAAWQSNSLPIDDFTGGAASLIDLESIVPEFDYVHIDSIEIQGIAGGSYSWQVVAIDQAGNRAPSAAGLFQYDAPPAPFDLLTPNASWTATNKPTFTWNTTTDSGSGLSKYQLWIDSSLAADNIAATATSVSVATGLTDGEHTWQIYAIDGAGATRHSRETYWVGVDTTPPSAFHLVSPANRSSSSIPTPTLCWGNTGYDESSGFDHYQLFLDGMLARDGITTNCSTAPNPLAEGAHSWFVKELDKAGNAQSSAETWTLYVDFNLPAAFSLVSPVEDASGNPGVVPTLTPTFTWQASASSGSGLDHYELYVFNVYPPPTQLAGLTCKECSIPATSTTVTVSNPVSEGIDYYWSVRAVDRLGGSTQASTQDQSGYGRFLASCQGGCQSSGAEPVPEPTHDAGVDSPIDVAQDAGTATTTSTATGTSTLTVTGTSSTTATSTATTTSIIAEPRADAGQIVSTDAIILIADAAMADAVVTRDSPRIDDAARTTDTPTAISEADAPTTTGVLDGGVGFVDSMPTKQDSGHLVSQDGAGLEGSGTTKTSASGCGCTVGGIGPKGISGWPLVLFGLVTIWRGSRRRRRTKAK